MASFVIEGGRSLRGTIRPIGNKNAALPLLSACLLTDEPVTLHNLPRIGDVHTLLRILDGMGIDITESGGSVTLCARGLRTAAPDPDLFSQIRDSLTLM
ncbi:MAG: UDP-N-acetylglucosamine 1-carboxyvinyltransferase, partial [Caldilineaceae bacterium]|nr:UDP-N-acetylglucosamine 1-carboxyvinyltransferase [Caldilineaceae bacterium]